ncbi:glutamine-hydrolyzing GMP synthase, partial [bacterium]|nr:glutamine-hydrolyzing GMP synthase [candidate division CSSED10-310 bacterium]
MVKHRHESVVILDFGSQYTQLIARRVREAGVFSEILPYHARWQDIMVRPEVKGVILSGGPAGVTGDSAPLPDHEVFSGVLPVLGICYGSQLMAAHFGGEVAAARIREYGFAELRCTDPVDPLIGRIFAGSSTRTRVWMSHGDTITRLPAGLRSTGSTAAVANAVIRHDSRPLFGIQFHPEVAHTECGLDIIKAFLFDICGCSGDWTPGRFTEEAVGEIRNTVGEERVLCALSGGVDSSVVAALLERAIGDRATCVFVDNGLLPLGEAERVKRLFGRGKVRLEMVDAAMRFLDRLVGVTDPEQKRKIIGGEFI